VRAIRQFARAGHVAGDEDGPVLDNGRSDLIPFEHPRKFAAVRGPHAKYLAGYGRLNLVSDLGEFDALNHERADNREIDTAIDLDGGALSQFGRARHRELNGVSTLQAVFFR
jgi:hypothetical protein